MALTIDQVPAIAETILSQSVTTPSFTTTVASEIIIVMLTSDGFFSANGTFTVTDSNGNHYELISRSNSVSGDGTCEAWYALVSSTQTSLTVTATYSSGVTNRLNIQVVTLSGHDALAPIGATGIAALSAAAVTKALTTTESNDWVFACFSNSSGAIDNASTVVGSNQTKISQGTIGITHGEGTFWRQNATTASPGSVTSNLTTPATDTGDMIVFEIVASGDVFPFFYNPTISQPIIANDIQVS